MAAAITRVGIVIPARHASTRFPGKPLVRLRGGDGVKRSLIEHSWRAACAVRRIADVCVATDDDRIEEEVRAFGGQVVRTPSDCKNGTERCAAAVEGWSEPPDIIINLQGDAPLTPVSAVNSIIDRLCEEEDLQVATAAIPCSPTMFRHLMGDAAADRVGGTTVVFDGAGHALYFSKRVIPYVSESATEDGSLPVHVHLGIYGYRFEALRRYASAPPSALELAEGLEQLRFLHLGLKVGVAICSQPRWDVIELNNPTDVEAVEAMLHQRHSSGEKS